MNYTHIYQGEALNTTEVDILIAWLSALHQEPVNSEQHITVNNRDKRILNHQHIFHYPLSKDNPFDLDNITPGLNNKAHTLRESIAFIDEVSIIGKKYYLEEGNTLIHGDFSPGNWLHAENGLKVKDSEFSFMGHAEFDSGVFLAHLLLSQQPTHIIERFTRLYQGPDDFEPSRMLQIAGIEIMRRIIGAAQLPIPSDLIFKSKLLELSQKLVLDPSVECIRF